MLIILIWIKIVSNPKVPNLKLMVESELLNIGIILAKVTLKIGQEKYLLSSLNKKSFELSN